MADKKPQKICKQVKKGRHLKKKKDYLEQLVPPSYICEKCGMPATKKELICKPFPLY